MAMGSRSCVWIPVRSISLPPEGDGSYYLRSSVLGGQVITAYYANGALKKSFVYAGGTLISSTGISGLQWRYNNPVTGDGLETNAQGGVSLVARLEPAGVEVGATDPANTHGEPPPPQPLPHAGAYAAYLPHSLGGSGRCSVNGADQGCGFVAGLIEHDLGEECLNDDCGTHQMTVIGRNRHGDVISRDTIDVRDGDAGWNGELDGTYGVYDQRHWTADGRFDGGYFLGKLGKYGTGPNEFYRLVSAGLPQNPGANPFPTLSKDNLKTVNDAIKLAQEMTKKRECDEALKAYGIPSLAALVNGMTPNGNVFDGRTSTLTGPIGKNGATESMAAYFKENKTSVGAAVFPSSVTGRGSVTFLGDYFFNPASIDWVAFQRAIIMMHESVHQVGGKGDAAFGSSKQLSEKIIEKCWPALKGKLGGVG